MKTGERVTVLDMGVWNGVLVETNRCMNAGDRRMPKGWVKVQLEDGRMWRGDTVRLRQAAV